MNNRLRWSEDMENTIKELKYRNHRLRHMQRYFDTKTLKIFGHGLIMSKLCSNLPAYGYRFLRFEESDPKNCLISQLQIEQNEMMRTILKVKRQDKVSIESMLRTLNMCSVNQLIAKDTMMETWKTLEFEIESMYSTLNQRRGDRRENRGENKHIHSRTKDPKSFPRIAEKLWNGAPAETKETNLIEVAKKKITEYIKKIIPV